MDFLQKSISSVFPYNWSKQNNMDNQFNSVVVVSVVLLAIANGRSYLKFCQESDFLNMENNFSVLSKS